MVTIAEVEVVIVGGGPAGLTAAITAAEKGADVVLLNDGAQAGGQLFKQIHKFFGSTEHYAGNRGFNIGKKLLEEAERNKVQIWLNSLAYGIFKEKVLGIIQGTESKYLKAEKIIVATGASESVINFPGWTLPGVMGAGAVQTLVNVHRVLPGEKFLMIGAGNVGLIVTHQLLLAGAQVAAVIEAAPRIGGYFVHAAKIRRAGVPILTCHTIKEAYGRNEVEGATIVALDDKWQQISGTEETIEVDTICLAVGLNPSSELPLMAGCEVTYVPQLGGRVPLHDENMETTIKGIYVAGDAAGIGEASCAMEEGRLAGIAAVEELGYIDKGYADEEKTEIWKRLRGLRMGPFGESRHLAKQQVIQQVRLLR